MKEFIKGIFLDGGLPSFSRIATGVIVAFALGWVTYLVIHNHALPDLSGLSLFVVCLYGANVGSAAISAIKKS